MGNLYIVEALQVGCVFILFFFLRSTDLLGYYTPRDETAHSKYFGNLIN